MQVYGQLQNAAIEILATDPASTVQGRIWVNSTSSKLMLDDGTTKRALLRNDQNLVIGSSGTAATNVRLNRAGTSLLQIVTGGDTTAEGTLSTSLAQLSAKHENFTFAAKPSPGNAGRAIYVTDRSALYVDNGSTWQAVGSGSGSGTKNYLGSVNGTNINGDFELASTTGWSLFNTTLTNLIPTGTISAGASSVSAFTVTSSGQLAGTYSLITTAGSSAWAAGQGFISDNWTVDSEDQAKVLTFKFAYKLNSGTTAVNMSGTSSNTFAVYIYDNANLQWIQPAGVYGMSQSTGVGICTGSFQTPANATSLRFAIVAINASPLTALSMIWDDFFVGPQTVALGAAITDWQSYTPITNGLGTVSNVQLQWMRVGGDVLIRGNITAGTVTAAEMRVGLPPGLTTADTTKIPSTQVCGMWENNLTGGLSAAYVLVQPSVTYVNFGYRDTTNAVLTPQAGNSATNSNAAVTFFARVPIQGWSSNVQFSNDSSTAVIASTARIVTGTAITAGVPVNFDSVEFDRNGNITTGAAWKFTASVSGVYSVSASVFLAATASNNGIYKNGSLFSFLGTSTNAAGAFGVPVLISLVAGDYIDIRTSSNGTASGYTGFSATQSNFVSIQRLSGPAVLAASETCATRYADATGAQSIPNATITVVNYTTRTYDSNTSVTTGATWKFTAPISGKYAVKAGARISAGITTPTIFLYKNGSPYSEVTAGNNTNSGGMFISDDVQLNAGEYIDIRVFQGSGGAANLFASAANFVSINRIGN